MTELAAQPPKIEFPCEDYHVKIIGDNCAEFMDTVLDIVCKHAPEFDKSKAEQVPSTNGRFLSVRVWITAQGLEQLTSLNEDLRATGFVRVVL